MAFFNQSNTRMSQSKLPPVEENDVFCSICLEPMAASDFSHPLMCPTQRCDFNFCVNCIESLLQSSLDDYMEASDGSFQVKVPLNCPNCRSDLSANIFDTVLLRKVDRLMGKNDSELSDKQLRLKEAIATDVNLQKATSEARQREARFFERLLWRGESDYSSWSSHGDERKGDAVDYEEWGVEVDEYGTHDEYFKMPIYDHHKTDVDITLLSGLEDAISFDDQLYITELMTSGDSAKLAEAAQKLAKAAKLLQEGVQKPSLMKRSSVYDLLHQKKQGLGKAKHGNLTIGALPSVSPTGRISRQKHREVERAIRRKSAFMKLHPLPVRMPKYVELHVTSIDKLPFSLCDDVWDGTVMDAFTKLSVWRDSRVTKRKQTNPGVRNILDGGSKHVDCGDVRIDVEHPRVVVASIAREGGRVGIMCGDVVTHVNEESLFGMTAAAVREKIKSLLAIHQTSEDDYASCISFVFNAERSTAEALKLRSMV